MTQPFTILLVEDEAADAHLVKAALREHRVLADLQRVADGREAMDFLSHKGERFADAPRPDLILLDLNMPRMDGREFLATVKANAIFRDIPVVVLTTSEAERDVIAAYNLGAAGYVSKPLDVKQFMDSIRQLGDYWITLVRLPGHDRKYP
ncbi:MAG TPA: response regulator [Rhodocyclaceae bacterium]|nr:response regulator [Rhodocyclaceae bacterium]